jgi:hypothetical protein
MSEENVEIVRAAIEATMRRPKPDWKTMNAVFHPDHEFLPRDVGLEGGGGHRGARGYRDWTTRTGETMVRTELFQTPEEAREAAGLRK